MSSYAVITSINETLKQLLWVKFQADTQITMIINGEQSISPDPPFKYLNEKGEVTQSNGSICNLSIYLYRVLENGDMKNRPLELREKSTFEYPPLSLNLFYLITPLTNDVGTDHLLLGRTMQVLYDNAILQGSNLEGVLADTTEELRVVLNPISIEDITRIWSGFMRPYRLSVSYEVKVVYIDSERQKGTEPIQRKRLEFTQINGSPGVRP
jgi:hypothetical protein